MSELTLTLTLVRHGGPGADWTALVDNNDPAGPTTLYGPSSSPGEVLEAAGQDLDQAETKAIVASRKKAPK